MQTDLYHFLSHAATGSKVEGQASSSWGWTSSDGREFVAIGQLDGTAFVEVSKQGKMIYLGRLESGDGIGARWREIRTVGDHIVVGSEAFDHGIQFFDMKKLLTLDPASPKLFTNADLASHWGRVSQGNPADAWDKLPVVSRRKPVASVVWLMIDRVVHTTLSLTRNSGGPLLLDQSLVTLPPVFETSRRCLAMVASSS